MKKILALTFVLLSTLTSAYASGIEFNCENNEMHADIVMNEDGTLQQVLPWFKENGQKYKAFAVAGTVNKRIVGSPVKDRAEFKKHMRFEFSGEWNNGTTGTGWLILPNDAIDYADSGSTSFNGEIRLTSTDVSDAKNNSMYSLTCYFTQMTPRSRY